MIKGIDISRWNVITNYGKVKNSGVNFAIIKAGGSDNGFYEDSKFKEHYAGCKAAGINVGAYYFAGKNLKSEADGIADAQRFLKLIDGMLFEYPVYLDIEAQPPEHRESNTTAAIAFCRIIERAGYYAGIYASDISGFRERLVLSKLSLYDKWVARYGSSPKYVTSYGIWQSSSHGYVEGINGNVDIDYSKHDYAKIIIGRGLNKWKS